MEKTFFLSSEQNEKFTNALFSFVIADMLVKLRKNKECDIIISAEGIN